VQSSTTGAGSQQQDGGTDPPSSQVAADDPGSQSSAPAPDSRFSMANERTFLSWNRTALSLIAGGLAVAKFLDTRDGVFPAILAVVLIVFGGVMAVAAFRRWRSVERALRSGDGFPPSSLPVALTGGLIAFTVAAAVLAALIAGK
jgi:putative membrane protein